MIFQCLSSYRNTLGWEWGVQNLSEWHKVIFHLDARADFPESIEMPGVDIPMSIRLPRSADIMGGGGGGGGGGGESNARGSYSRIHLATSDDVPESTCCLGPESTLLPSTGWGVGGGGDISESVQLPCRGCYSRISQDADD